MAAASHTGVPAAFPLSEDLASEERFKSFVAEIRAYLGELRREMVAEAADDSTLWDDQRLHRFLRNWERQENARRLLQYMLAFLKHLPTCEELRKEPVDPYAQFREFVAAEVGQLRQGDVLDFAMREYLCRNHVAEGRHAFYRAHVLNVIREFEAAQWKDPLPGPEGMAEALRRLQGLCYFWYQVRGRDVRRMRRHDLYAFILAGHLLRLLNGRK